MKYLKMYNANSLLFFIFSEKDLEIEDLQTRMEHYSRIKNPGGTTYVRWGRTTCPETSELVYDGYAGGGSHGEDGAGTIFAFPRILNGRKSNPQVMLVSSMERSTRRMGPCLMVTETTTSHALSVKPTALMF